VSASIVAVLVGGGSATAEPQEPEVVVGGLDFPTGIDFSPDGRLMYVNERVGRVRVVDDGGLRSEPLATIPTTTAGETGLLDIAVSPDGRRVFVFATDPGGQTNRVLALPASGGEAEVVLGGLPAALYHNGGAVAFDRDGNLLISNGEIHDSGAAQDADALGGKIYRVTAGGSAVAGNPFGSAIALGLRNPFGMTVDPVSGDAFVTDNGPSSHDEVNRIVVGGNYGWPDVLGDAGASRPSGPGVYRDPISVQQEIVVPTGIAIADPENAGREVAGDVFYGTFGEQTIRRIELNDDRDRAVSDEVFIQEEEPVIAVSWGPEGLYYSTPSAIKLVRLTSRSEKQPDRTAPPSPAVGRDGAPVTDGGSGWIYLTGAIIVIALAIFLLLRGRRLS